MYLERENMNKIIETVFGKVYHPVIKYLRNRPEDANKLIKTSFSETEIRKNRIYVDITQVFIKDVGTGVQRVTNNILVNFEKMSSDYDIVKVYLDEKKGVFDCESKSPVSFIRGDIFFELDLNYVLFIRYAAFFRKLMKKGVKVSVFIHDLIPIRYPQFFDNSTCKIQLKWMKACIRLNQIIANSESTIKDVENFINENPFYKKNKNIQLDYSLLGCDFSAKPMECPKKNSKRLSFLMVSTVDRRKNYKQAVHAFSLLWESGYDVELKIVGRPGWCCEDTIELLENHPELGKRLFWYKSGISDEELAKLYSETDAVIFASLAEGFGLAITEGAYYKKPLILRNLSVFMEIAGDNALYFNGLEPEDLAEAVKEWIKLYELGQVPDSSKIKLRTWQECTIDVYNALIKKCKIKPLK